ncbi:MAG: hypothetical protein JWP18_1602 [Solirubrobacterales bacterium]|jgi:hypothetical protein|nr:hypothetical protein [Solirubrobacterales bacterium]
MHRPTPRLIAISTVLTGLAAPAAGAQAAPAVSVTQPCQVATFGLTAVLSGFAPNTDVGISGSGIFETATTDATGSVSIPFRAPALSTMDPKSQQVILTASEATGPATATAKFRTTNFAFGTNGGQQSPKLKRTWSFSGLAPGKAIYGHFRYAGQTRVNHRFGLATKPCGELKVKAPGIPVKGKVNTGKWTVQIDQKRVYDKQTTPRLTGSTTVVKVFKSR